MTFSTTRYGCLALVFLLACFPGPVSGPGPAGTPDPMILGDFLDDYGSRFRVTAETWTQLPRSRYHIVRWHPEGQYLIARNDPGNPTAGNLWTRIDWMQLPGMAPYTWGFCLSAFESPTAEAAESILVARRETPRAGCNGFPFSRMKPADPPP